MGTVPELRVEHDGIGSLPPPTRLRETACWWPSTVPAKAPGIAQSCATSTTSFRQRNSLYVMFDRRGEGKSSGDASRGRFDVQARDALAVLAAVDVPRSGLFGYSQGGWVAPLAAAQSRDVGFLVVVASPGVTPSQQMMYATESQLRLAGHDEGAVANALELRRDFEAWVHQPQPARELEARLSAAADEDWFGVLFLPPLLLDEEGRRLWIEEMDFDPRPVFARVRVPTLALWGEDDSWILLLRASRRVSRRAAASRRSCCRTWSTT